MSFNNIDCGNVQELDIKELREIDGGIAPLVYVGVLLIGMAVGAYCKSQSNK